MQRAMNAIGTVARGFHLCKTNAIATAAADHNTHAHQRARDGGDGRGLGCDGVRTIDRKERQRGETILQERLKAVRDHAEAERGDQRRRRILAQQPAVGAAPRGQRAGNEEITSAAAPVKKMKPNSAAMAIAAYSPTWNVWNGIEVG